jgi:hypothetical protein
MSVHATRVAVLLAMLALAPAAQADVFTAAADSPQGDLPHSQDIRNVQSTYDSSAGTWSVAVTLYGPPSTEDWGNLAAVVYPQSAAGPQCGTVPDTTLAAIDQASTRPGSTSVYGAVWLGGGRPAGSLSKGFGPDPDTITLQMADAELVGQTPACMTVGISHSRPLDRVGPFTFSSPGSSDGATPSKAPPLTIGFTARDSRLTASRAGVVRVDLAPFVRAVTGVVTLRTLSGASIGRASYEAEPGEQATARVRLAASARRTLARRHRLTLRIVASARTADGTTVHRSKRSLVVPPS